MRRVSTMTREQDALIDQRIAFARSRRRRNDERDLKALKLRHSIPHLEDWGRAFFPHYIRLPPSKMHSEIVATLHGFSRSRLVGGKEARIAPRSGAKTTWISKLYPLYCICHSLEHYILMIGDTGRQAQQNLQAVKHELTSNRKLADAYPDICGPGEVWNVDQIVTRNGINVQAIGAGSDFRGSTFREHRPGLIIVDDLDNDEDARSEDQRDKMWQWFSRVLMPMGDVATNFLAVGTALHEEDTIHRLLKTGEWGWKRYQALMSEPTADELWRQWRLLFLDLETPKEERQARAQQFYLEHQAEMDAGAELLWPERESLYSLMCYRTAYGEAAFQSEKQGFPTSDQSTEWPPSLFVDTTEHRLSFQVWPDTKLRVMALDPSKGKTDASDFSAFIMLGLGTDGLLYVDADIKRRDVTRIVEDGFDLAASFHPDLFLIETNQFQELLATEFSRQANERGTLLPLSGFNNTVKKQTRIRRIGPYLQLNQIRFRADSLGVDELLKQLRQFPHCKHDDGPDALDMAIEGLKHLLGADQATDNPEERWTP